jgi:hypothetical protein
MHRRGWAASHSTAAVVVAAIDRIDPQAVLMCSQRVYLSSSLHRPSLRRETCQRRLHDTRALLRKYSRGWK